MPSIKGQTLLNQYRVDEFIASTPVGDLYRATDIRMEKNFALTVLPKNIYEDSETIKELDGQSARLRALTHPHLIPYLGLYQTPSLAFMLEEWVDGPSLRDVLALKAPLSVAESLIYIKAICGALEVLHKNNFLHLNVAPELIRINKNGEIFLSGIGAAQREGAAARKKTGRYPRWYSAPEAFTPQPLTSAADMYALAVILYQLVTTAWINGTDAPATKDAIRKIHLEALPPAPISLNHELPDHFSRMILWALRKKADERFKTTVELLSALSLAAKFSLDEIPRKISSEAVESVTVNLLNRWKFLPPPKPTLLKQDLPPLQDRLAALDAARPKKKKNRAGWIPVLLLLLAAGFILLLLFIRPAPEQERPEIFVPPTLTPLTLRYTATPSVTPSPRPTDEHGGRIVFTCARGAYNHLCMVHRDGSGLSQLTNMEASNYYPVFTRDGESLLFASNRNGAFDLYLLSFAAKDLIQITRNVGNVVSPDYSPDGRQIVFANRVGDNPTAIWMVNADGLNPRLVYTGKGDIVATAWSPRGDRIAYAMSVGVLFEYEIFTMDVNGKNHVRLTQNLQGIGGSLSWSPDDSHLLISAGPSGDKDIFKLDAQNGNYAQITDGGNNAGAAYSPDGKYIVFNSLRNQDQADLYIMRADGSNQTQLTNHPEPDWGPRWAE